MPRHDHEIASLSIVLGGDLLESSGATEAHGRAWSLAIKPAGAPHANLFGPAGAVVMSIRPGQAWLDALSAACWQWRHAGPALGFRLARAVTCGDAAGWAEQALVAM